MSKAARRPLIATFSIVASDGTDWGVAVASKFLAVGSAVPAAEAGVGALATQALANTAYKRDGLKLLHAGRSAQEVIDQLTADDDGRRHRQLGVVDGQGRAATYTGSECLSWAGGRTVPGCACQGNILVGPEVVDAMIDEYQAVSGPLVDRLLAALEAGDAAGGDRRGRQSAALLVTRDAAGYGGFDDRMLDLRAEDHERPIPELRRLHRLWKVYFEEQDEQNLLAVDPALLERLRRALAARGRLAAGDGDELLWQRLQLWMGEENLEERWHSRERVDPVVLEMLEGDAG